MSISVVTGNVKYLNTTRAVYVYCQVQNAVAILRIGVYKILLLKLIMNWFLMKERHEKMFWQIICFHNE